MKGREKEIEIHKERERERMNMYVFDDTEFAFSTYKFYQLDGMWFFYFGIFVYFVFFLGCVFFIFLPFPCGMY